MCVAFRRRTLLLLPLDDCLYALKMAAAAFLRDVVEALPYLVHKVLTDNGIQFSNREQEC